MGRYKHCYHNGTSSGVHIAIAEKAIGKRLPKGAHVHHVDLNGKNNTPSNLVVCPSASYHRLLHRRTRAINAGFPAHYLKCSYCKQFDDPENLVIRPVGLQSYHQRCFNKRQQEIRNGNR